MEIKVVAQCPLCAAPIYGMDSAGYEDIKSHPTCDCRCVLQAKVKAETALFVAQVEQLARQGGS